MRTHLVIAGIIALAGTNALADDLSQGSGVVVGARGGILTANHVVKNCSSISAQVPGGYSATAVVVARDDAIDLAVISFSSGNPSIPTAVPIRDTSVRLGEAAIVMGYPLADRLSATHPNISVGYVSAVVGPHDDTRYLQTTAPVQPGNSGGPLLDASGHLIGIVVSKLAPQGPQDRPENIGFAVKGAAVRAFLDANHIAYVTARSDKQLSPDEVRSNCPTGHRVHRVQPNRTAAGDR